MKNSTKYWLITDTHFGHKAMLEYCGRPEGFEEIILENLIKVVGKDDVVIHLGDVCMGNEEGWHNLFIDKVPGKKWLIKGNHDNKSNTWYLNHGWDFVCDSFKDRFFGKNILFSHVPQYWDNWYDLNIHGHFHNTDHRKLEPELLERKNNRQRLLAIENTDYKPILLERFIEI